MKTKQEIIQKIKDQIYSEVLHFEDSGRVITGLSLQTRDDTNSIRESVTLSMDDLFRLDEEEIGLAVDYFFIEIASRGYSRLELYLSDKMANKAQERILLSSDDESFCNLCQKESFLAFMELDKGSNSLICPRCKKGKKAA